MNKRNAKAIAPVFCFGLAMALTPIDTASGSETGIASRYSSLSKTASGRRAAARDMVAAHRTLPFGRRVQVENLKNGKSVTVIIIDRGPFVKSRIIDLSSGAAEILGLADLQRVRITVVVQGRRSLD